MISVVIPCLNEKEVLGEPRRRMSAAEEAWGDDYEIIVVDDGSDEETWQRLRGSHSGDFSLIDRTVVNLMNAMPERNRFLRGLRAWVGFRFSEAETER
jgi:glycosyltransferase involved in cell wall biosynthesis